MLACAYGKERWRERGEGDMRPVYAYRPLLPCLNKGEGELRLDTCLLYLEYLVAFYLSGTYNVVWKVPFIRNLIWET